MKDFYELRGRAEFAYLHSIPVYSEVTSRTKTMKTIEILEGAVAGEEHQPMTVEPRKLVIGGERLLDFKPEGTKEVRRTIRILAYPNPKLGREILERTSRGPEPKEDAIEGITLYSPSTGGGGW